MRRWARAVRDRGLGSARDRFERRALATRRRPWVLTGAALGVLLLAGGVVWLGWFSTLLTVRTVEVRGVADKDVARITEAADVPRDVPVMRVDTDAVVGRLEAERSLKDVSVTRSLPHTIVIEGTPRVAVLAVRNVEGSVDVVDAEGVVFRTLPSPPGDVPLVTAGSAVVTPSGLAAALEALSSLPQPLRSTAADVTVSAADHVRFTVVVDGRGRNVVWGGPGDAALKARLVTILAGETGRTIDVSAPRAPVTR